MTSAMAGSLPPETLRLESRVRALRLHTDHVEVMLDGEPLIAPFVICTLPFSAMRSPVFKIGGAPDNPARSAAINALPYTQIQQVIVEPVNRFWETDALPAGMWTDTPIQRVFSNRDESGNIVSLTCWINGRDVRTGNSDQAWFDLAALELQCLRGAKVKGLQVVRWDQTQPFSGGAYMHWAPGQTGPWAGEMGISFLHTGMEGAMESGERAALALPEAFRPL